MFFSSLVGNVRRAFLARNYIDHILQFGWVGNSNCERFQINRGRRVSRTPSSLLFILFSSPLLSSLLFSLNSFVLCCVVLCCVVLCHVMRSICHLTCHRVALPFLSSALWLWLCNETIRTYQRVLLLFILFRFAF
jgi:hypothetical protein